ncbi:hypothetical protein LCGC14_0570160 [marine sediment metagenome]|uniref:Uncharacterized protein n=1 Tax=marine sediment metagenome TaxID=412755 RepID=A0A0F9RPM8_9ZZZZ
MEKIEVTQEQMDFIEQSINAHAGHYAQYSHMSNDGKHLLHEIDAKHVTVNKLRERITNLFTVTDEEVDRHSIDPNYKEEKADNVDQRHDEMMSEKE